jgi:hypothetical protein
VIVQINGQPVELVLPRLVVRHDIAASVVTDGKREQTARRVLAAALLLCWSAAEFRRAPRYRGDMLEYGGEAIEWLLEQGATMPDIVAAGQAAAKLVLDSLATAQDHERAKGNSVAPAAGASVSNAASSAGGGSLPTG